MLYRNFRSSILQRFLVWAGMLLVLGALFAADLVQHRLKLEQAIVGLQQTTAKTGELTIVATRLHEYGEQLGRAAESAFNYSRTINPREGDKQAAKAAMRRFDQTRRNLEAYKPVGRNGVPFALQKSVTNLNKNAADLKSLASRMQVISPASPQFEKLADELETLIKASERASYAITQAAGKHAEAIVKNADNATATHYKHITLLLLIGLMICTMLLVFERMWLALPLSRFARMLTNKNDRDVAFTARTAIRQDEIGILAQSIVLYDRDNIRRRSEAKARANRIETELANQRLVEQRSRDFSQSVADILTRLEEHAERMHSEAESLAVTAKSANKKTGTALGSMTNAAENASQVSRSIHELSASTTEIHRQVVQASQSIVAASQAVDNAGQHSRSLTASTEAIETVIKLIQSVAERTNLLALNATIEAARAGDVGRGFAVVASEIKSLATQTSAATSDIREELEAVVEYANRVGALMTNIVASVAEIEDASHAIASTVEGQTRATHELDRVASQNATQSDHLQQGFGGVAGLVGDANKTASVVLAVSDDLTTQAIALRGLVSQYISSTQDSLHARADDAA